VSVVRSRADGRAFASSESGDWRRAARRQCDDTDRVADDGHNDAYHLADSSDNSNDNSGSEQGEPEAEEAARSCARGAARAAAAEES
jgi:hypothetical protein